MSEAESGVIGCILIDNDSLHYVYGNLQPAMFASEFYGECYERILALYDMGEQINVVALAQKLDSRKWAADSVTEALKRCVINSATSEMIKSYSNVIMKAYRSREAKRLFEHISFDPNDIDDTIAEILARFEELQDNTTEVRSKSMKQIVEENKGKYFTEHVGENVVKTGFYKLDECVSLEGGDVTVIGARPGVGKSAIVTQMIGHMAKNGKRVGYYNLEMGEQQVYERFVARLSEIELTRIRRANAFIGDEQDAFNRANDELVKYNVIISTGSKKVGEIRSESRHQGFDIIIVDYLQLIKSEKAYGNRASEVGDISKALKGLAMELNIPIVLLSQLNRVSEQSDTKEPTMSELRESGDIEQDASAIILMWNLSNDDRSYKGLKVDKNRQGETLKEGLKFDGSRMTFTERQEKFEKWQSMARDSGGRSSDDDPFGQVM